MPFYYSDAADRGHVEEQARRIAAGREPFKCAAGCPCLALAEPQVTQLGGN